MQNMGVGMSQAENIWKWRMPDLKIYGSGEVLITEYKGGGYP
jgi:hypothetical protein